MKVFSSLFSKVAKL